MAFDPNLYAIQLEMDVNSVKAEKSLTDLGRSAENVEMALNKAMNSTLAQANVQVSQFNEQLKLSTVAAKQFGDQKTEDFKKFDEFAEKNLEFTAETEKQLDLFKETRDLYKEQLDTFKLQSDIQDVITKKFQAQAKAVAQVTNVASNAYNGLDTASETISEVSEEAEKAAVSNNKFETALNKINSAVQKLANTVQGYWISFLKLTEVSERFATVNNRTYGSMHEITGQAHLTSLAFGLLSEKSLNATEALINIGVAKESLDELVVAVVQTNRVTGLSFESLAELTRQYEATGEGVQGYRKAMTQVMAAQRQFNLSVSQTQKVLDMHNASLHTSVGLFGNEAPKQILKSLLAMQAMTRDTGAASDVLETFAKELTASGVELLELHAQIGGNPFGTIDEKKESILNFYDRYAKHLSTIKDKDSELYRATANRLELEVTGMGRNFKMVLHLAELRKQAGMQNKTAMQIQEIYTQRMKDGLTITGEYQRGMAGLNAQWDVFRRVVFESLAPIANFIADGMWPFIWYANQIIQTLAWIVNGFVKLHQIFERLMPPLALVRILFQRVIGLAVLLTVGFVVVTSTIAAMVIGFYAWITVMSAASGALFGLNGSLFTFLSNAGTYIGSFFTRITASLQKFFGSFSKLFTGGTTTLSGFMTKIGQVLVRLGNYITAFISKMATAINIFINKLLTSLPRLGAALMPLVIPMLAIGATMIMMGAAAWLLAKAFQVIAEYGWVGIAMFFAFLTVIGLFALALVGLGALAGNPVVAGGLLAIGAAILLIGIGVALAVGSIALLVVAFTGLLNAITSDIKERIVGLTDGLLYLSSYAIRLSIGLGIIGIAFAAVAIPLGVAGVAFAAIGYAITKLVEAVSGQSNVGGKIGDLSSELSSAATKLSEAKAIFGPGVDGLSTLSDKLSKASDGLLRGALAFNTASQYIFIGASMLMRGAELIPQASGLLISSSGQLLSAGLKMLPGAESISRSARALSKAGISLLMATPSLLSGATGFYFASSIMAKGIERLEKSSIILQRFAVAAKTLERLNFIGLKQGINDLGNSVVDIDKYVSDMEKASLGLQDVRFDVTDFTASIVTAANSLSVASDKLQTPIDKLSVNITEMVNKFQSLSTQLQAPLQNLSSGISDVITKSESLNAQIDKIAGRFNFSELTKGLDDLKNASFDIDGYIGNIEKAASGLANVRFDVTGFTASIVTAANSLNAAIDKLQIPIDKLASNINEMVIQIDKLTNQETKVSQLGASLSSAMPDKPDDLQQPAEFKKADGQTELVNNVIEVKQDSSEMVALLKRLVALAEGEKTETKPQEYGTFMSSSSPTNRLKNIGIDI